MNIAVLRRPDLIEHLRIFPNTADPAWVKVKYLNDAEWTELIALADKLQAEGRDKESAYRIAYGRVAVKGYGEIFDGTEVLAFTEENTDFLMLHATDFRAVVLTAASSLQRAIEKN